jgi:uncharacterized membrane protein YqaE (UPF0057 family)
MRTILSLVLAILSLALAIAMSPAAWAEQLLIENHCPKPLRDPNCQRGADRGTNVLAVLVGWQQKTPASVALAIHLHDGKGWVSNPALYKMLRASLPADGSANLLPGFITQLHGIRGIRIHNLDGSSVTVGIRSGISGKNLVIPANATRLAYVPDGIYDVYIVYSNRPQTLFRGGQATVNGDGVEIWVWGPVDGNRKNRHAE